MSPLPAHPPQRSIRTTARAAERFAARAVLLVFLGARQLVSNIRLTDVTAPHMQPAGLPECFLSEPSRVSRRRLTQA
jgi:hypothetical protein